MNLAAIFVIVIYFLGLGGPNLGSPQVEGASPAQAPSAQSPSPAPATASSGTQPQNAATPGKQRKHRKKTIPDCADSPAAPNPAPSKTEAANSATSDAAPSATTASPSTQTAPVGAAANAQPSTAKPCPPPKKVVKNGGSDEPVVQLKGNTTSEQASQQRSTTEQLTAATEQNLKKVADRQLSPSQQEMVNQVKQFIDQAKKALAAGDLQRGHNLAVKANLLSAELVKP